MNYKNHSLPGAARAALGRAFSCSIARSLLCAVIALLLVPGAAQADFSFGEQGTGAGQLGEGRGVAVDDSTGNVYVVDQPNQRIDEFEASGAFVRAFGWGVLDGADELEVCTATCQRGVSGTGAGQLDFPAAVAIDQTTQDLYVTDPNSLRVEKFGPAGAFLFAFGWGVANGGEELQTCGPEATPPTVTCQQGLDGPGAGEFHLGGDWEASAPIAVGPTGTVYVGSANRVQEFTPSGAFAGSLALPAPPAERSTLAAALAVDSSGNLYVPIGTAGLPFGTLTPGAGVRKYDSSGAYVETLDDAGLPRAVAVDQQNDLLLGQTVAGEYELRTYDSAGRLLARFFSPQIRGFQSTRPQNQAGLVGGIAATDGQLYATNFYRVTSNFENIQHIAAVQLPAPGPPVVTGLRPSDVQPTTATLRAVVDPKQFDTHSRFQWITEQRCKENEAFGHGCFLGADEAPPAPGEDLGLVDQEDPVQAAISGLTPRTAYRWRVVAENECNGPSPAAICSSSSEARFETLPDVSLRQFTTQTVGPELVELKAELNPNGSEAHYEVRFGESSNYEIGQVSGRLPTGNEYAKVGATFTDLKPDTTYHYQLAVRNGYGEELSPDQTVTTEATVAEEDARNQCPNAVRREENNSLALPDCRAYEKVTPDAKEGGEVTDIQQLAPSGERVQYVATGAFAGAEEEHNGGIFYLAQRTGAGWVTQPVIRRIAPRGIEPSGHPFFSGGLDSWLYPETPGATSEQANFTAQGFFSEAFAEGQPLLAATPTLSLLEGGPDSAFHFLQIAASSEDLSRIFIRTSRRLLPFPEDPRPADLANAIPTRIYEVSGVGTSSAHLNLVTEVPLGLHQPGGAAAGYSCWIDASSAFTAQTLAHSASRQVSADGSTLVYSAPIENEAGADCGEGQPNPLADFARTARGEGSTTVQLNAPPPTQCQAPSPCAAAAPRTPLLGGISPDGSRAWFMTTQPLINSDTDATRDLYLAKLEPEGQLERLVQASAGEPGPEHPVAGKGAAVKGFVAESSDGSEVAFVASGALTTEPNSQGETAAVGAENLYVYDAGSGLTRFVGRLCSDAERSGSLPDSACPASLTNEETAGGAEGGSNDVSLWVPGGSPEAQFSSSGNFLVFTSFGRLAAGDTDAVKDIYRYDLRNGQILRLSFGHRGNDGNGNDDTFPAQLPLGGGGVSGAEGAGVAELAGDDSRAISADGSLVVFATAAPLVSRDTNAGSHPECTAEGTGCDVYEWEEEGHGTCAEPGGCVALLSDGRSPHGAITPILSASGADLTFETAAGLTPGDSDGVGDLYDARAEGGFPPNTPPPICETGEACHGQPGTVQLQANPVTEANRSGGNPPASLHCAKGRHKVKKHGQVRCVPDRRPTKHRRNHKSHSTNRGGKR